MKYAPFWRKICNNYAKAALWTARPSRIKESVWQVQFLLCASGSQLVWPKKHYVTDRGIQLTSFGPKHVTLPKGGSK